MKLAVSRFRVALAALILAWPTGPSTQSAKASRQLLIVLDGLRPDYVTPALMPALHALGRQGVVFERHHAVYPTVTRVNASSIASGAYPGTHGLMGNSVFFPKVDARRFLDTEDRQNLIKIEASGDRLLTTTMLGELLQAAGKKLLVVSAGSTGASYLLNGRVSGGAVIQTEYTLPASFHQRVVATVGEADAGRMSSADKNRRAVDAFLKVGLPEVDPAVTILWFTDPDTVAHQSGIGTPATVEALKRLDGEIKRLLEGLSQTGVLSAFDIWVTSDHGFSTYTGAPDLKAMLQRYGGALPDGTPRIVAGSGAIYVRDHDANVVAAAVRELQDTAGVGAIFTPASAAGSFDGRLPGTLSFDAIRWTHERSADILFSPDWTDRANAHGYKGTSASSGTAGHGSSSPFDIHNILMAAGPDVKARSRVNSPSGNVDFAPTFLHLLGLGIPESMEGRVLVEAFETSRASRVSTKEFSHTSATPDGKYLVTARFSLADIGGKSYRYLDSTFVKRRR
jgi:arylsulfatase A-like enzyme